MVYEGLTGIFELKALPKKQILNLIFWPIQEKLFPEES